MSYSEIKDKAELLMRYEQGYSKIQELIKGLSEAQLDFIPFEGAWSIREFIAHILDDEFECFIRYRQSIAEPDTNAVFRDIYKWEENLGYSSQSVELSMQLFKILRTVTLQHLLTIKDNDWNSFVLNHPKLGKINLSMILSMYTQHIENHLPDLERNINAYKTKTTIK